MQYALVNQTTGQVIAPFNTEAAARGQADKFPPDHETVVLPFYQCVEWALSALKVGA